MATTTKTFTFDSTIEDWAGTPGADVTMTRITGDGSPGAGCLSARLAGKNNNPGASYWKWIGTLESLGVPVGATVQSIGYGSNNDYNWRCSEYVTGSDGNSYVGPFAVYDNTPILIGTFSAAQSGVSSTTSWATVNGTSVALSDLASSTTIQIWVAVTLRTGNSSSAAVTLLIDQVVLEIEYTEVDTSWGTNIFMVQGDAQG